MKTLIEEEYFNVKIEPSDWRYSAAIVGLARYFDYYEKDDVPFCKEKDCIKFNSEDITEERYLKFAEYFYGDGFHHVFLENLLKNKELSEEQIKLANEKLSGNTTMKAVFKGYKTERDREKILTLLNENRLDIIKGTFKNKSDMYANFCNTNQLFEKEGKSTCRLLGYYVDAGKKSKSLGYRFQNSSIAFEDVPEFDFIPFGFAGNRTFYFINCNYSIENLISTNNNFKQLIVDNIVEGTELRAKEVLFKSIVETAGFIDYDVEVISKNTGKEYFETMFIRKSAIRILKEIKDGYKGLRIPLKVNDNYYINIQDETVNHILNNTLCDDIIERIMGNKKYITEIIVGNKKYKIIDGGYSYCVKVLIDISSKIKGVNEMTWAMREAKRTANSTVEKFVRDNRTSKLDSYRQKLISSVTFKDYDRATLILLNLSSYTGIYYGFAYDLFEDFENNKEIIYTFINALTVKPEKQ
ncbi:MAG: type I CRISPR-associated protein Cas8a1/Csx8 [Clostridiales bacterium]|nr:type I CRISPR-associated protein Cas8a1/Csx8 [Clostridiales bacterium]